MATLKEAIKEFLARQLAVYRADGQRLARDARSARRAASDHIGRWPLELLQNSDDAKATKVHVRVVPGAVYVADNGEGFKPSAVEAISGTDFSDKTSGTIGRKGIGFKAVYTVSQNPQIFSLEGEGLEFSQEKAKKWLHENGISNEDRAPHQWLPFFVSRKEAEKSDTTLVDLREYRTVVKLPSATSSQHGEFPLHGLLPFNHVKSLEVRDNIDADRSFTLEVSDSWVVTDSRQGSPITWRVSKPSPKAPPDEVLSCLDEGDRERVRNDGIGLLVAAPLNESGIVLPAEEYLPVHVFYATEEKAPVRMLLHAEFLVKSDRTALIPVDKHPFNRWIADQLAHLVVEFVQGNYDMRDPAAYLRLLLPLEERETHPVANALWDRIAAHAKEDLRLPDTSGELTLSCAEARLLGVSSEPAKARKILEATPSGASLLHKALDEAKETREALEVLECRRMTAADVLRAIDESSSAKTADLDWIWTCWEWLSGWIGERPYGDEHAKRLARAKELRILPVDGVVRSLSTLPGIVTWRKPGLVDEVPEWLSLSFVDDWFRDRIDALPKGDAIRELLGELDVTGPGDDVLKRALGLAIAEYWKQPVAGPERFLQYLMQAGWVEGEEKASKQLGRCPVRVRKGSSMLVWASAEETYFGREWGDLLLADLYEGMENIAWVQPLTSNAQEERAILEWLGCMPCPRVLEEPPKEKAGTFPTWDLPNASEDWRRQCLSVGEGRDHAVAALQHLDHIDLGSMEPYKAAALLCIVAANWETYYQSLAGTRFSWFHYSRRSRSVDSLWWYQIRNKLVPPLLKNRAVPAPLLRCWLPDKRTRKAIGELLPTVDLGIFGEHKPTVEPWLREIVRVRTSLDKIKAEEWRTVFSEQIPSVVSAERATTETKLRERVAVWYEACLDSLEEQEGIRDGILSDVPLLCRKGERWEYVADEEARWLRDHNEAAKVFREETWQFVSSRASAAKYFGIRSISKSVDETLLPTDERRDVPGHLTRTLEDAKPFVYAWRRHRAPKEEPERLRERLSGLGVQVVEHLEATLTLGGVGQKRVERQCGVVESRVLILVNKVNPSTFHSYLARGLAEAVRPKSDSDFYENLFRCRDDEERKAALISRDIPEDEIHRFLREFREEPAEMELGEMEDTEHDPLPPAKAEPAPKPSGKLGTPPSPPSGKSPVEPEEKPPLPEPTLPRPPLCLKNSETAAYDLAGTALSSGGNGGGSGGGEGGGGGGR